CVSVSGVVDGAGCPRFLRACLSSPACPYTAVVTLSPPDDHFSAGPDRRVKTSASGRVGGAGGCPRISHGIVSPACVQVVQGTVVEMTPPNDHFTAGPDSPVIGPGSRRVGHAGGYPTIRARIVSPACVQVVQGITVVEKTSPNDHFTAGPHCRVIASSKRGISGGRSPPPV